MVYQGEPVELDVLEEMAVATTQTVATMPEEFFLQPDLARQLIDPMHAMAQDLFGSWVCRVTTDLAVGLNIRGEPDEIRGFDASFVGKYHAVDLRFIEGLDPSMARGFEAATVPILVFDTMDDSQFDGSLAQTYLWAGVPLLGSYTLAERYPIANQ